VPYYMNNKKIAPLYPRELKIRYPKVGSTNPRVKARVIKVSNPKEIIEVPLSSTFAPDNLIIGEFAWLTDAHERFVLRCFNRIQNMDKHLVFDIETKTAKVVRERDGSDCWIDNKKSIKYVGPINSDTNKLAKTAPYVNSTKESYYVDVSDEDGWMHLYLYPTTGGKPKQLTSGKWEVRKIQNVDGKRGMVYFSSSERHPTESHVYSINLSTGEKKPLTNSVTEAGYWDASFSAQGKYYVLSYEGPNVPYQELYWYNSTEKPIRVISDNSRLTSRLNEFDLPRIQYFDLPHPSGHNLSAMLRLPPSFSPEKKYPVLLTPYGGPTSQEVHKRFDSPGWGSYISSDPELEYITYTVDNRGTGQRGRKFRCYMHKNMGVVDAEDQIWAATELAKYPWVDSKRIGIWGWSNGGYLSAKVVEANSGIISLGLITAPTSDMRLYDSMFTERYMGITPQDNAAYDRAAVRNATGFKNIAGGVLIQHGTGDDNVHYQHTATMVDTLIGQGVPPEKLQIMPFTDSDHSINYNNQNTFLYKQLTKRLYEEKMRVVGRQERHQWTYTAPVKAKKNNRYMRDMDEDSFMDNMLGDTFVRSKDWRLGQQPMQMDQWDDADE
jgi:dipeptidyl-peptidase-4